MTTTGPRYVNRYGFTGSPQPFLANGVSGYCFVLEGTLSNLEDLCARYLSQPADGRVQYRPLTHYVLLTFDQARSMTSVHRPYRDLGSMGEGEVAFWVLTAAVEKRDGVYVAERFAWFVPYIFVDNPFAIIGGREVYGFPKEVGWFHIPSNPQAAGSFSVDAIASRTFGAHAILERQQLFAVNRTDTAAPAAADEAWTTIEGVTALFKGLLFGDHPVVIPGVQLFEQFAFDVMHHHGPLVFLRQLYDIANGDRACYQSIVEASVKLTGLRTAIRLPADYQLTLPHFDSHPIARDLGLQHEQQAVLSTWMDFDFVFDSGRTIWTSAPGKRRKPQPTKVAILGGGVGAMSAAFELTSLPDWQERYDITVYQLGWRLGGKGASGRNAAAQERIEEHGLHIWLGFYENAFNLMQRCYAELGRSPDQPLATWQQAFEPHHYVVLEDRIDEEWTPWAIQFPPNDGVPGTGGMLPAVWEYIPMLLDWMVQTFSNSPCIQPGHHADDVVARSKPTWWDSVVKRIEEAVDIVDTVVEAVSLEMTGRFLEHACRLARALHPDPRRHSAGDHNGLLALLQEFLQWLWRRLQRDIDHDPVARHLWLEIDLGTAIIKGLIEDDVIFKGFDSIDHLDLRAWLHKHGAAVHLTTHTGMVRAVYDLAFAYRYGDIAKPAAAAGAAVRGLLRMMLTYKGAVMWKMQAGMGDTIFAPLYEVLKRRGVRFKFFQRVSELHPVGNTIGRITIAEQANLKGSEYRPLVNVKGLPCWPSTPLYEQLVEGPKLKRQHINLESAWTTWKGVGEVTLQKGRDFDIIVLGISLGALPMICPQLIAAKPQWRDMVKHVETIRTQAFQLWLRPDLEELGWTGASPVLGAYVEPLDTWADMSQLIARERWPTHHGPGNISYFCGVMKDSQQPPFFTDPEYPLREADKVKANAIQFLEQHTADLWPGAVRSGSKGLRWDLLMDPRNRKGAARFNAQFWRVNVDPSERYVLTVPGSTKYRLGSDESGFDNLYLAGDWTRSGLNAGCVEGAVMSGMQAARAICGSPTVIVGEGDLAVDRR